jgi:short-subunit dehydrogenase
LAVNVTGFVAIATAALEVFEKQASGGHLVGISSIAGLRGNPQAPAYSASKAFVSNYLEGIRCRFRQQHRENIVVTTIEPGFVDTDLVRGDPQFWTISSRDAAAHICTAIRERRPHAYVSGRWRLVAWMMKLIPESLYWRHAPNKHH